MLFSREIICSFPFIYIYGSDTVLLIYWKVNGMGCLQPAKLWWFIKQAIFPTRDSKIECFNLLLLLCFVFLVLLLFFMLHVCWLFFFIFLQFISPLRYSHKCFCLCCFALVSYRCCYSCGCCCCCCLLLLFVAVDCCCCLLLLLLLLLLSSSFLSISKIKSGMTTD